jgi:hypothetical protein
MKNGQLLTYPFGECGGIKWWTARIDALSPNGLPLQLRRIDRTTAIEATLEGRTVLLTGPQVEQFWKMVEGLK